MRGISGVKEKMRSREAWCFLYELILVLVSNQSIVPVKIDGRQQQEETSGTIENQRLMYTPRACSGLQVQYLQETNAKLGGVVLYGDTHPNCNVQSVNCTCEN